MADCGMIDFGCKAASAVNDAFVDLANKMIAAVGDATASLATFWMHTPEPSLGGRTLDGGFHPSDTVSFLQGSLQWLVLAGAVLSVLIGAGRMAWERRAAPARELARSLITLILVSGAGLTGITLFLLFTDGFSKWMIGQATTDFGASLVALLGLKDADAAVLAVILVIVVAFIALCASLIQIVLLIARNGFLIVLAASWPLSASATNTEQGRAMFQRQTSWLFAFLLYKPAASVIYATAFKLVGGAGASTDPVGQAVTGFTLMVLSLVALPALMKLVAPIVSAATNGGGGGGMLAAAAVAAPSGSAIVRSTRGAGGGAGGGGRPGGPTGSRPAGAGRSPAGSGSGPGRGPAGGSGGGLSRGAAIAATIGTAASSGAWTPGPPPPPPAGSPPTPPGGTP